MKQFLRRAWPWFVGVAIVIVVLTRVPFDAFKDSIHEGPHLTLAAVDAAVVVAILVFDTFATWVALAVANTKWSLKKVFAIRGATYVLSLINYAVGQGGIGFYLHRDGVSGMRAAGITLFMMGTTFVTLAGFAAALSLGEHADPRMVWTLAVIGGAFVVYLVLIAVKPRFLQREVFLPLFETGLRGHGLAVAGRIPHVAIIVLGHWFAMLAWGYDVPFGYSMLVLPIVVLATVVPISPAGLGTTQAALVYFFQDFAPGATADARAANVLAFGIVHFVYGTIFQLAAGLICVPFARRYRDTESR
jgi:uncharacterized membrane protein YbhN (UPF0104 family)